MKIAITGATGMVGKLLVSDYGVYPLAADITDESAVQKELDTVQPHVVIHLAGISNVDYCEALEHVTEVMKVNYWGAVNVIRACNERSIICVFLSSEHVFSGRSFLGIGGGPYSETSLPGYKVPNRYGLFKLGVEGLRYAFPTMRVIRSSFLFDRNRLLGMIGNKDFPTFLQRSPIYLPHFVSNLHLYAVKIGNMPIVLNLAGSKTVSQYQLMKDFVLHTEYSHVKIHPRRHEDNSFLAPRPHKAGLDVHLSASLGFPQYSYLDGLDQMEKDYDYHEDYHLAKQ